MSAPDAAADEFRTPRPIAGWRVVAIAFWLAVFAWGLGFYSLSLYVHHLGDAGWPTALLSAATTGYFLLGAAAIGPVERAAARWGRRRVAIAGALLLAGGVTSAAAAVAATTAASLVGRLMLSVVIDRVDHRAATAASFLLQAAGMALLLASDAPAAVLAGCVLFGLSVGNVVMLPAIFAQREFAPERYGAVVARVWTVGQTLFALGPLAAGALLAAAGSPAPTLAACLAMQVAAAALCAGARGAPRRA